MPFCGIFYLLQTYKKVVPLDAKEAMEVSESYWRVSAECKVCKGVGRRLLAAPFGVEGRLHGHEVLHEEVALLVLGHAAHGVLDAQLDRAHQLVGLHLLVGDLALLVDPSVPDFPLLVGRRFATRRLVS